MNHIAGIMKMHIKNKNWFFAPWLILLLAFVVNLFIGFLLGGTKAIYTGGLASIYIYMLILGTTIVKDTFPFTLGFSVRRTDYYLGTLFSAIAMSAVTATLLFLLSLIETNLTNGWGVGLYFFHLPYVSDGPLLAPLWTYFAAMVNVYFLGFAIACLQRRFGNNSLFVLFGVTILATGIGAVACTRFSWWGTIFHWFGQTSAAQLAMWTVPVTVGCLLVSYMLLRKASI